MKPKFTAVLEAALREGLICGWNRAHKHTDTPGEDLIRQTMEDEVWNALYYWFDFEETHNE